MSAPKSEYSKMMKRFDGMAEQYQQRIDAQKAIIDRMTVAHTVMSDALHDITTEVKNVKEARTKADEALGSVRDILTVPRESR